MWLFVQVAVDHDVLLPVAGDLDDGHGGTAFFVVDVDLEVRDGERFGVGFYVGDCLFDEAVGLEFGVEGGGEVWDFDEGGHWVEEEGLEVFCDESFRFFGVH